MTFTKALQLAVKGYRKHMLGELPKRFSSLWEYALKDLKNATVDCLLQVLATAITIIVVMLAPPLLLIIACLPPLRARFLIEEQINENDAGAIRSE